jgi:hypothetical protein
MTRKDAMLAIDWLWLNGGWKGHHKQIAGSVQWLFG